MSFVAEFNALPLEALRKRSQSATGPAVLEALAPLQQRYRELSEDSTALDLILKAGAERAAEVANRTLIAAKKATGLL